MTFPTVENGPWTFSVNNWSEIQPDTTSGQKTAWILVKNVLASFSQWSVIASSNGTLVSNIGAGGTLDHWDTIADIVGGQSWIILENSVTGEQLCMDVYTTSFNYGHFRYSATGSFQADGTTSVPPTVTESVDLLPVSTMWLDSIYECVIHGMVSADGKCTRIYIHQRYQNNWTTGGTLLLMDEVADAPAVWTSTYKRCVLKSPAKGLALTTVSKSPAFGSLDGQIWYCHLKDATPSEGNYLAYSTAVCIKSLSTNIAVPTVWQHTRSSFTDGYCMSPIGLFRPDVDHGGGLGRLQDIFWAPVRHEVFQTYDQPTERAWIKIGGLILPWNGSIPRWI